tara:strand:- start:4355 stop:5170 length:816 start_codon:yes stop_codon:yes gene_type:complete
MRLKHNKKRNTAFLFETLSREYVKAIIKKSPGKQDTIKDIIKENFCKPSVLNEELSLYREILESQGLEQDEATAVLEEAKRRYDSLNKKQIFHEQNKLIKEINYKLSQDVFTNFVPNYKNLATIYNIFNNKTSIKEKVLLEQKLIESLTSKEQGDNIKHVDNLTYKTFVNKFNEKYGDLPKEQKELLTVYIASFADNSLELKHHLNEQISDLKVSLRDQKDNSVFESDQMKEKYDELIVKLDSYKNAEIDISMVSEVLKIQEVVRELQDVS